VGKAATVRAACTAVVAATVGTEAMVALVAMAVGGMMTDCELPSTQLQSRNYTGI
jgi:hypothetical protein